MATVRQLLLFPPSFLTMSTSSAAVLLLQASHRLLNPTTSILQTTLLLRLATPFGSPLTLAGLWESILRAVPKKKTSHSKKRSRFLAGKALKDVTALNKCSACGNIKRAHLLCPFCVEGQRSRCFSIVQTRTK